MKNPFQVKPVADLDTLFYFQQLNETAVHFESSLDSQQTLMDQIQKQSVIDPTGLYVRVQPCHLDQ